MPPPNDPPPAGPAPFTAAERGLIRSEFRARGGQTYPLDDGIWLHRWAAGPLKGQPKLSRTAIRTLLARPDRDRRSAGPPPLRALHPRRSGGAAAHGAGPAVAAAR